MGAPLFHLSSSSLPPSGRSSSRAYCCPNPTEQATATYVMWKKGKRGERGNWRKRGEERTDSCGLHASAREENEGERERVRGEKLDLLSEWLSRAHKSLELKLIVRKEISSYKVSSLNACSV